MTIVTITDVLTIYGCCEGNVVPSTFASEFDTRKALY